MFLVPEILNKLKMVLISNLVIGWCHVLSKALILVPIFQLR